MHHQLDLIVEQLRKQKPPKPKLNPLKPLRPKKMDRLKTIKDEITNDPAGLGYTADDVATEALINAKTRLVVRPASIGLVLRWAATHDVITKLEQGTVTGTPQQKGICKVALAMLSNPHISQLDLADPEIVGMFGVLASGTPPVIDPTIRDNLFDRSKVEESRSVELGLGGVTTSDIADARRYVEPVPVEP